MTIMRTLVAALVLAVVGSSISACGFFGSGDGRSGGSLPNGWDREAVEAIDATPGAKNRTVRSFVSDDGMGDVTHLEGLVDLAGDDAEGTYVEVLRNVSASLGPDANVAVDIKGVTPDGRTLRSSDVKLYVSNARGLWEHFHGQG